MATPNFSSGAGFGEELSSGVRVGGARYILKRLLGRGENSEVWLAQDVKASREVALKFLPAALLSDANVVERLKREAQGSFLLVHPHIAATYEFVRNFSSAAIAVEYVEGWSLATFKIDKPQQRYQVEEIEWWIRQLCAALDFAHNEFNIIHRDLKPSNLLVNAQDELKVTDFGIADSVRTESARRGLVKGGSGGLGFLSPQQVMGAEPSRLDDVYSIGATIFDLLTSTPPFYKGEIIAQICGLKAPSMKERLRELGIKEDSIPSAWEAMVAACLAKNPAKRPQSVKEALQLLEHLESPKPVEPPVEAKAEPAPVTTEIAVESPEEAEPVAVNETEEDEDNPFTVEYSPEPSSPPPAKKSSLMIPAAALAIIAIVVGLAVMKWKPATSDDANSTVARQTGLPGSLDQSFNPGTGANEQVRALVLQPDGKVLVAGNFTSFNSVAIKCLARLDASGSVDNVFKPNLKGSIDAVTVQPNGKIFIGGERLQAGHPRRRVMRLNADGGLDQSFGFHVNYNHEIRTILVQPDGKIIVGGSFSMILDQQQGGVVRLNADGALDKTFALNGGASATVWVVAVQPDGKILVAGELDHFNGLKAGHIVRLNPDGSLDSSFNAETDGKGVFAVVVQNDGRILIAGEFKNVNGQPRNQIARLNPDGSPDANFHSVMDSNGEIRSVAIQADGKIILGGNFSSVHGEPRCRVARLNADGSLDKKFNVGRGAPNPVWRVAQQPDGKILVGGAFENFDGVRCGGVVRLQN